MVRIGDQVHTKTTAYLCVYATIADSVIPAILYRNRNNSGIGIYLQAKGGTIVGLEFMYHHLGAPQ